MPPGVAMGMGGHNDVTDMNKDVEFISEQQPIEVRSHSFNSIVSSSRLMCAFLTDPTN